MTLSAGTKLGPYEILSPLGAGGMGEVYKARDTRLERSVAVKVLPEAVAADSDRLRRFEQEARSASALNHPNILTVHDVGESGGRRFVVTELLEGETLRELLARGVPPLAQAVGLATELFRGLAAAHEKGVVHRDVKPENLFLTRDGRLKILDFGLARMSAAPSAGTRAPTEAGTEPGVVLGTAAYMSPEQVRGQPLDARTDIFSAGIVLHELVSGRRPFGGGSAAEVMTAILMDSPPPLSAAPPALDQIARRCLEKIPESRFQHARDVAFTLESISAGAAASDPADGPRSVAVLLFRDLAGDPANAHVGLGLADATITELAAMKSLRVRPTSSVLRFRERVVEPEAAGRELGVDAVLDGNFQRSGSRLRVTVQLVRTLDGKSLWGAKIDTSLEDLFQMQDEVSRRIAEALEVELTPADERRLARTGHGGSKAFELYLQGRLLLSNDTTLSNINAAIECFEEALEADPASTLSRLALADAYTRLAFSFDPDGDWYTRAETVCEEALAANPDLPEGRYLRGRLLWHPRRGFDNAGALREFCAAIAGRPNLAAAHHSVALVLAHVGLLEESLRAFETALEIDPQDSYSRVHRGLVFFFQGHFEKALAATEASLALASSPWNVYQQVLSLLHLDRRREAAVALEKGSRQFPDYVLFAALRGLVAALDGDAGRAREQIELVVRNARLVGHYHHAQYDMACIETLLGRHEAAVDWLSAAARGGFPCATVFETDPWLAALQKQGPFRDLLAEVRAERDGYSRLYRQLTAAA